LHQAKQIPGYRTLLHALRWRFLSGQPLPHAICGWTCSQLDFAPPFFHLLELPIPEGWWVKAFFAPFQKASAVAKTAEESSSILRRRRNKLFP